MNATRRDWTQRSLELAPLLARTGLGDRTAFASLYERCSATLFAVVLRINGDRAQAEDILQEVFIKVWRSAQTFDAAQSQPLTWLTSIARNHAIDNLRRQQARPRTSAGDRSGHGELSSDDPEDPYEGLEDTAPGPLELLNEATQAREVTRCLQALNAQQRQCVALAFYQGMSHSEVADQLHEPLGSVKSWVRRGLLALKSCLESAPRPTSTSSAPRGGSSSPAEPDLLESAPRPTSTSSAPRGGSSSPAEPALLESAPRPTTTLSAPRGGLSRPAEPDLLKSGNTALGRARPGA